MSWTWLGSFLGYTKPMADSLLLVTAPEPDRLKGKRLEDGRAWRVGSPLPIPPVSSLLQLLLNLAASPLLSVLTWQALSEQTAHVCKAPSPSPRNPLSAARACRVCFRYKPRPPVKGEYYLHEPTRRAVSSQLRHNTSLQSITSLGRPAS